VGGSTSETGYINKDSLQNNLISLEVSDGEAGDIGLYQIGINLYKINKNDLGKYYQLWWPSLSTWIYFPSNASTTPVNDSQGYALLNGLLWINTTSYKFFSVIKNSQDAYSKYLLVEGSYSSKESDLGKLGENEVFYLRLSVKDLATLVTESSLFSRTTDFTSPTTTISPPSTNQNSTTWNYYVNSSNLTGGFTGEAKDTLSGIDNVSVEVYAGSSPNFWSWNGTAWVFSGSSILRIPATYNSTAGTWAYNTNMSTLIAGLKDGDHYAVRILAKDKAGNQNLANATFIYDNTAPTNPTKIETFNSSWFTTKLVGVPDPNQITNLSWTKEAFVPFFYFQEGSDAASEIKSYDFELAKYKDPIAFLFKFPKNYVIKKTIPYKTSDTASPKVFNYYSSSANHFNAPVYEVLTKEALPDGLYEARVKASDEAGNVATNEVSFYFGIDSKAPTAATELAVAPDTYIAYKWKPGSDEVSGMGNPTIYIKGPNETSFSLLDGKSSIDLKTEIKTDSSGKNYYVSSTKLKPGNYSFYIITRDVAGNTNQSLTKPFEVKLDAPTLISPADKYSTNSLPSFSAKTVSLSSESPNFVKNYALYIYEHSENADKVNNYTQEYLTETQAILTPKTVLSASTTQSEVSWNINGSFDAKTYSWRIDVYDNFGNIKSSEIRRFTLTQPVYPKITLASPADKAVTNESSATFSWGTSTSFTSYDLYLNGTKYTTTAGTYPFKNLSDGIYKWYVQSTANIGLFSQTVTSQTWEITVDTKEPTISLSSPAEGVKFDNGSAPFAWIGSYKFTNYDIYIDGKKVAGTDKLTYSSSLGEGSHSWYVSSSYKGTEIKSKTQNFYINSIGPTISAKIGNNTLANDAIISPTDTLTVDLSDDNGVSPETIAIAIDGTNITGAQISAKDTANKAVAASLKMSLKEGTHTVKITAKDALGKENSISYSGIKTYSGKARVLAKPMNYPNPFKPSSGSPTTINYSLSDNADIKIMIFDLAGRMVWQNSYPSGSTGGKVGENEVTWDGKSSAGQIQGNGAYLYTIISEGKLLERGEMAINE